MPSQRSKQRKTARNNKRRKLGLKTPSKKNLPKNLTTSKTPPYESSDSDIQTLLEPYSKDQILEFLIDAAVNDSSLLNRIRQIADSDVSHRKIFVYGLGWDTTQQTLTSAFQSYGEIEDCKVVVDRNTGKAKGYGFVLFRSRIGAVNALKQPQKKIGNRVASCQLASIGPFSPGQSQDAMARKIYVSNVPADVDAGKLRAFFGKFGEIETGPLGFDVVTGKSRGFALFVYKTVEGVKKALEEPYKMFEGHQLHCQRAGESKNKGVVMRTQQQGQQQQIVQAPMLAAVAAAQNLALFGQHPSLNPAYNALAMNASALMAAGGLNSSVIQSGQVAGSSIGVSTGGLGAYGYGGSHGLVGLGGNSSILEAHGSLNPALQGLQSYHGSQFGQSSSSRSLGAGGSLPGYSSYL